MSRISKQLNKAPVRSPSPDTACKHIIQRTPSPVNEILTKSRKKISLKSPIGSGFINTDQYEEVIKTLKQQNKILTNQNQYLIDENEKNMREIDFLKEMNLKQRKEIYRKSDPNLARQPDVAAAYEEKIREMSGEFGRLQDLLSIEKRKREAQEWRVQMLEKEAQERKEGRGLDFGRTSEQRKKQLQDAESALKQSFDRKIQEYQIKVELVLKEEIKKLDILEKKQGYLFQQLDNHRKLSKEKNEGSTAHKSAQKSQDSSYDEKECPKCKTYLILISQLQAEIARKSNTFVLRSKQTDQQLLDNSSPDALEYLRKLQEIRSTLQSQEFEALINDVQTNYSAFYNLQEKFDSIIAQKNSQIMDYERRDLKAAMEMAGLKRQNRVLQAKISKQQEELQELKRIITAQIQRFRPSERVEYTSKKKSPTGEADLIRKHIEIVVSKVQNLEEQIASQIKE